MQSSGNLIRIGTDNDWKSVPRSESSVFAIKQDGAFRSWEAPQA